MAPGYKRESWRPQPSSSWAPGKADTFRPAQDGPSSASGSRHSPPSPSGPSSYTSRVHTASTYRPPQDEPRNGGRRGYDRDDDRRDGSDPDRAWGGRSNANDRRGDGGRSGDQRDPPRERDRPGPSEPHKGGYGRDYNETVRNNDIKKGTFRTKAQIQNDMRIEQAQRLREQQQSQQPNPNESTANAPTGPGESISRPNEPKSAERPGSSWNARSEAGDRDDGNERRRNNGGSIRGDSPTGSQARSPLRQRGREEPGRGRRASPDYGGGKPEKRRSPSRDSLYSPLPRKRSASLLGGSRSPVDRKRAPTSPRGGVQKRQRDESPDRSIASPRRRRSSTRSRSRSRDRQRRPRSPSPRRNFRLSPSPRRDEPRRAPRQWGRRPSPDRSAVSDRRERSPPPPPRRRSPSPHRQRDRAGSSASASAPGRGPPFGGWGRGSSDQPPNPPSTHSYAPPSHTTQSQPYLASESSRNAYIPPSSTHAQTQSYPPEQPPSTLYQNNQPTPTQTNGHGFQSSFQQATHPYQQHQHAPYENQPPNGYPTGYPPQQQFQQAQQPPSDDLPLPSGTIKVSLPGSSVSPVKGGWKSLAPHPPPRPAVVRQFFDSSAPTSPVKPSSPPRSAASSHHVPHDPDRPPLQPPEVYQKLLDDARNDFQTHFDKLAPPYLRAAFQSWSAQPSRPDLPDFLGHYFGRRPQNQEINQMESLLGLQNRFSRDQDELQDLHRQAMGGNDRSVGHAQPEEAPRTTRRDSAGHWSPPRERLKRDSWSPQKKDEPLPRPSASANSVPIPEGRNRFGRTAATMSDADHPPPESSTLPAAPEPVYAPHPPVEGSETSACTPVSEPIKAISKSVRLNASGEVYERLAHVGEGTYGKVYKARHVGTGTMYALKRIRMEGEKDGFPVTAMREIKLLQNLRHRNVLRLVEMMVSKGSVYMVLEYMDHDLTGVLAQPNLKFTPANLKSLNHQMLSGLAYLHESGILHRDMKGSNILLNAAGELKLADFGLARMYSKRKRDDYTNRVITLWYRGPELLLGETVYGPEVDMWSAGCIMLELFCGKPVFQGNDEIHQLEVIYSIMGTPDETQWPGVKDLPWYELVKPKEALPSKFKESFKKWLTPAALDLAEGLLDFDPFKRLSAEAALKTAYFKEEEPEMELPTQLANCGEHHEMSAKLERHRRRQQEGR